MLLPKILLVPGLAMALIAGALAQTDDCTNPTPIGALGTYAWISGGLSTGFPGAGLCSDGSTTAFLLGDKFWVFTAPFTASYEFDTNGSSFPSGAGIMIHDGIDCSATCLAYSSMQTPDGVQRVLNMGDTVVVQVGTNSWLDSGPGVMNISTPCANLAPDAFEDNDSCPGVLIGPGFYYDLNVDVNDSDYYSVDVPASGIINVTETYSNSDGVFWTLWNSNCTVVLASGDTGLSYLSQTGETVVIEAVQLATMESTCSRYDFSVTFGPNSCDPYQDDAFEDNDDCATATNVVDGTYTNLWVSQTDQDQYAISVDDGATITVELFFDSTYGFLDLFLWDALSVECGDGARVDGGGPFLGWLARSSQATTSYDDISWTNTTGASLDVVIEVNPWDRPFNQDCNFYDMVISTTPEFGGDSCAGPDQITGFGSFFKDTTAATTSGFNGGGSCGLGANNINRDWFYQWTADATTTGRVKFDTFGSNFDTLLSVHAGIGCAATCIENNDDANGTLQSSVFIDGVSPGDTYLLQGGSFYTNGGSLVVNISLFDPGFSTFCDPAAGNSTGGAVVLSGALGSGVGSGVHMEVSGGPPLEFGFYVVGALNDAAIGLGNGVLCINAAQGVVGRYNVNGTPMNSISRFDAAGIFQNLSGTSSVGSGFDLPSNLPIPGSPLIMSGETWHFQVWYRDTPTGPGVSNLSNGLSILF